MAIPQGKSIRPADTDTWSPPLPAAAGFEHFMIDTPGLHTHVATIGDGEPVIMLHGFPQHWWQWRNVAPAIAAEGFQVFCPDLRGAGWTVADDPYIERQTRLRDLLAIYDALQIESAHVISHDMGVLTAMQLSYEYPERVRSAIQLSVFPGFAKFHPKLAPAFRHLPGLIWYRSGASLRDIFSRRYMTHPLSDEIAGAYLAPLQRPEIDAAVRPLVRKMLMPEALRIVRGAYRRRRLSVPTLVVFGRQDHPTTEELMNVICKNPQQYADHVEFAYVNDAAHFIVDDAPEAVATLATGWLAQRN
ncbi:alpha/beta fold hydrolase [Enteractinococcus coprophilus]|uniref:Pimeloyl-ACP methyl ester carboxylesterase n=1 Tax=Enteractinococcus coprophilus TaxID=1027633 RepID=A0A543AGT7_9MICC|nr:alpha/beta hydrolase [Enteractinococcus coprophilus]TQL71795.1 pimeloyl-ACP methyl ester carboxylesterase [Enteractinococcus coprophilus]